MFIGLALFKKELRDFVERVPRGGVTAIREEGKELFSELVNLTPKDTNFASSKWSHSINNRPPSSTIKNPRNGSHSPAKTPSFYNLKGDDTLYIYNQVEYMKQLEDGWSKQAPKNFVKNATARARYRLQKRFDRIK